MFYFRKFSKTGLILVIFQEALALSDSALPKIKVHATVIFSILNSFVRRSTRDARVIGTLLGEVKDGVVTVSLFLFVQFL
jgi:hypothetical protein